LLDLLGGVFEQDQDDGGEHDYHHGQATWSQNWPNNSGHTSVGSSSLLIDRTGHRGSVRNEGRLGVHDEHHLGLATGALPPHNLQGSPDALCPDR